MAKTALRLDKVDLFSALRVGEGEGFDPADSDFINPAFGESGGEGSPLISRYVDNVEPQIPIHVSVRDAPDFTTVQNEIPNPRFRGPSATGWTATSTGGVITQTPTLGTGAIVGAGHDSLAGSILLDANTTQVSGSYIQTTSDFLPIAPGQRLSAATWLTLLATDAAGLAGLSIAFYDSSFAGIGGATVDSSVAVGGSAVGTVLRILSSNLKAPDSAAYYKVTVYLTNTSTTFRSKFYLGAVIAQKDCAVIKMYHDGDSPGWQWTGTEHTSTSFGPAVPMANLLFNPRPSVDTIAARVTSAPNVIPGWSNANGNQGKHYIGEDDTSPTGTAIIMPYDTATSQTTLRNTPCAAADVMAHHILPGDFVCLSAWMKANAAAQSGAVSAQVNIDFQYFDSSLGTFTKAISTDVSRSSVDWQRITVTLQIPITASRFLVDLNGRGSSVADAETRFAGVVLARGSTQAEAEAIAKTLGSSSFHDGDSLDAEWVALSTRRADRPLQFSYRYTDKPGLQSAIAKVENLCLNAQSLEWRDDGARRTTFRDVLAGRFEADYKFRRAQRKWFSGMVHLWTRPYAHSGTFAIAGTAADASADDPIIGANIPRVGGDYNADVAVAMQTSATYPAVQGRIVGVCAAPSGRVVVIPAGSLIISPVAGLTSTSWINSATPVNGALGMVGGGALSILTAADDYDVEVAKYISTPSVVAGRSRVLAFVRSGRRSRFYYAVDSNGNQIGAGAIASSNSGFNIADLGVMDVTPNPASPTNVLSIRSRSVDGYSAKYTDAVLTGLLLIPEDNSQIAIDTVRKMVGWDEYRGTYNSVDKLGNTYTKMEATLGFMPNIAAGAAGGPIATAIPGGIVIATAPVGSLSYADFYLSNAPTTVDLEVSAAITSALAASAAFITGKRFRNFAGANLDQYAQLHFVNASLGVLSLWSASALVASMSVPSVAYTPANFCGELRFRSRGGILSADLRVDNAASVTIASIAATTAYVGVAAGQPFVGMRQPNFTAGVLKGFRAADLASTALAAGDRYEFSPTGISRFNAASQFTGRVAALGQSKLQASPGFNTQVYAFEQSLDEFTGANQRLSIDVRVRERFTYAR